MNLIANVRKWALRFVVGAILLALVIGGYANASAQTTEPSTPIGSLPKQIEDAFRKQDGESLASLFDRPAFARRCTFGTDDSQSITKAIVDKPNYFQVTVRAAKGGSFRYLRSRARNGSTGLIFRLAQNRGILSYYEFVLTRNASDELKIVDFYTTDYGDFLSEIARETSAQVGIYNKQITREPNRPDLDSFRQWNSFPDGHDPLRQIELYHGMPEFARRGKANLIAYYHLAELVADKKPDECTQALKQFTQDYPDDLALDVILLNSAVLVCNREQVSKSMAKLQEFTGGDPYLVMSLGNYDLKIGKPDSFRRAEKEFRQAIDAEPTVPQAYFRLIDALLDLHDFDEVAQTIDVMQDRLGYHFHNFEAIPEMSPFVHSQAYRQWLARHQRDGLK